MRWSPSGAAGPAPGGAEEAGGGGAGHLEHDLTNAPAARTLRTGPVD
ncbi:hypothetical protein SLI_4243 [Streptomyces lividans 1326]|uniref:Uncharacterized protein n=1 Tax=Streptomyces lividans 1326 TaxID=1200984 RepID=A0A7U9HCB4_STRLI|nr:hypothetical protein SLI_4243 [Streptomyces lividans 1326]